MFKDGDLVEIHGYSERADGCQGIVHNSPARQTDGTVIYFVVTKSCPMYSLGNSGACMYVRNLRLVDDSKSFIPEDWS